MKTIKAIIILVIYVIFTRALFVSMVILHDATIAFLIEITSASFFGLLFLYFFDHENIFSFAKIIKDKKKKTEEKFLSHFLRFGSLVATIIIGYVAGPLFCALTTHLLLKDYKYKYILVFLICFTSSFLALALARGVLHLVIRLV